MRLKCFFGFHKWVLAMPCFCEFMGMCRFCGEKKTVKEIVGRDQAAEFRRAQLMHQAEIDAAQVVD